MGAVAEDIHADYALKRPASSAGQISDTELITLLLDKPAPALRYTIESLKKFAGKPNASIHKIIDLLRLDPGYSQHLFSIVNSKLESVHREEACSLNHAILVLGIPQVIAIGRDLPVLEDLNDKQATAHIYRSFSRSYHAGVQAREWSKSRSIVAADTAFFSAQLRENYLTSLWYHAADKLTALLKTNNLSTLCLPGGLLNNVAREVARKKRLPQTLQQSYSPETAESQLAKTVSFCSDIALLAENGWSSGHSSSHNSGHISALVEQAVPLLGYEADVIHQKLHQHAVIAARESNLYPARPIAARLVEFKGSESPPKAKIIAKQQSSSINQEDIAFRDQCHALLEMGKINIPPQKILKFSFKILSELIEDKPIGFFLLDKTHNRLKSRYLAGFNGSVSSVVIPLGQPGQQNIFKRLMQKQQSVLINTNNRKEFARLLLGNLKIDIKNRDFIAISLFIKNKPVGLFYAELDADDPAPNHTYKKFITLCKTTRASMEEVQKHAKN
jgi:hypothetical protein